MGIGFTFALIVMATIREVLGAGTFLDGIDSLTFGLSSFSGVQGIMKNPIGILVMAPGGFLVFGLVMALANKIAESKGKPKAELTGCSSCPMASTCSLVDTESSCDNNAKEESAS